MKPDLVAVLMGGTLVNKWFAGPYYSAVARQFGQARIMTIPGSGTGHIQRSAELINAQLERDFPGSLIAAFCHSQSGLELAQCALDNSNIVQVAAAGTPFHGTPAAWLGLPLAGVLDLLGVPVARRLAMIPSTDDMLPGSGYLRWLHRRLPELARANRLATVSLRNDRVVPWPSSRVDGARNYLCCTDAEFAAVRQRFPDTRHISVSGRRPGGHILGLQLLEPALEGLLKTLWQHAQESAALLGNPLASPEAA